MNTLTVFVDLEKMTCGNCGGVFALNQRFLEHARKNAGSYHCPYCQTSWGWHESEAQKLRKQLEAKSAELSAAKCDATRERMARPALGARTV